MFVFCSTYSNISSIFLAVLRASFFSPYTHICIDSSLEWQSRENSVVFQLSLLGLCLNKMSAEIRINVWIVMSIPTLRLFS